MGSKVRHIVAEAAEVPVGKRKIVNVSGLEIGIFNVAGHYHALRNRCPHKGGPICRGRVRPLVVSEGVYHVSHQREGEIIKCPWHQWEFDIKTGRALCDRKLRVKTYLVAREGDKIALYLNSR